MKQEKSKPVLAVPMGDPNGIGPEIIVKALAATGNAAPYIPLIFGHETILQQAMSVCGVDLDIHCVNQDEKIEDQPGTLQIRSASRPGTKELITGEIQALAGRMAADYIEAAVSWILAGKADALVTPPIHKEALQAAGVDFIGHTEMLAGLTKTREPLTLFETLGLRVFFLSRHVSLRKACDWVTQERLEAMIERCLTAMRQLNMPKGNLAVAGLNPHCGEHGLFGDEEVLAVTPAIVACQKRGLAVSGPVGADSVFHQAKEGKYAAVLSLYHDQGHIATKTLDFERTIALTLGLPFLRTSVDHGTAFDIAGQGMASSVSMQEALRLAALYCQSYTVM